MTASKHSLGRAGLGLAAWICSQLMAERERWALWLPVGFALGIGIYFGLDREPPSWLGAIGLLFAAGLAVRGRRRPDVLLAAAVLGMVCAGFAAAQWRSTSVAAPVIEKRLGPVFLQGQVLDIEPRGKRHRLTLHHLTIPVLTPATTPGKIRISVFGEAGDLRPGESLRLRAVLMPPPEPALPGAFDFARQAYFKGLGGVGFAAGRPERLEGLEAPADGLASWRLGWTRLRLHIAARVRNVLSGDTGAVAAALMTGERGAISEPVMQAMRDSGLAHLLAISGLHVGLVAGLLFFALRALMALAPPLVLRYPVKKWAALVAVLGAFAYLQLTGATVPTQRAFMMTFLVLLAVVLDRTALTLRLVAWAAFAVLVFAPESLLSASFQMSFAAVTALIAGYELLRERRSALFAERSIVSKIGIYLAGVALTSVIAGLATAPFAVYHFNRIAWYGLAANLIAVPLTALWIMPWAIAAFLLLPFGAESLALIPMGWGIDAMLAVAAWVAAWPGAISLVGAMPTAGLVLVAFGGVWLCLWRRPWRLIGFGPVLAGALTMAFNPPPDLLASGDGKLFGLRTPEGEFLLSTLQADRFEAEVWRRRLGQENTARWPRSGLAAGGRLRCDPLGCIYRDMGQTVAFVQDSRALMDDCAEATVVLSREPVRRDACSGNQLIVDRFDMWRVGGHALWLSETGVRIESVRDRRGSRPWTRERG